MTIRTANHQAFFTLSSAVSENMELNIFNLMGQCLHTAGFRHREAVTPHLPESMSIYRISSRPGRNGNAPFSAVAGKIRIP